MEPIRFRVLLLRQALFALVGGAGALMLSTSVNDTAGMAAAVVLGGACVVAAAIYVLRAWQRSPVLLDREGITLFAWNEWRTWPYARLESVTRAGRWHVRLCFGAPAPGDPHEHAAVQLLDADAFAGELRDRYAAALGHELPDGEQAQPAA
jgi:hypothetical protein